MFAAVGRSPVPPPHIAAQVAALELAARLSGRTQREIGRYYGGISSSAMAMMRKKVRLGEPSLKRRIERLLTRLEA